MGCVCARIFRWTIGRLVKQNNSPRVYTPQAVSRLITSGWESLHLSDIADRLWFMEFQSFLCFKFAEFCIPLKDSSPHTIGGNTLFLDVPVNQCVGVQTPTFVDQNSSNLFIRFIAQAERNSHQPRAEIFLTRVTQPSGDQETGIPHQVTTPNRNRP